MELKFEPNSMSFRNVFPCFHCFIWCFCWSIFWAYPIFGQKNVSPEVIVSRAKIYFANGQFDTAISILREEYKLMNFQSRIESRKLISQSYIGLDSLLKAKEEIKQLLIIKPDFEPAYDDSPVFADLTEEVRNALASKQTSSVSKKTENIEDVPATMTIITQEDIRNRGYRDLEALFHDISGFDISRSVGLAYSNLYQRGFRSAANTDRTMLLIDGIEDNELWSNTAFISRQYPLSNIKRVEIIYGPSSTTYGANAFLGVVNVVTKNDSDLFGSQKNFGLSAQTSYGSMNTRYVDITAGLRKNKISLTLTGRLFHSDEMDLSNFEHWDYQWNSQLFASNYASNLSITQEDKIQNFLQINPRESEFYNITETEGKVTSITPTELAINNAKAYDEAGYNTDSKGNPLKFTNPTDNLYLAGKLKSGNFKIGFYYWNRAEGAAPSYSDRNVYSGSLNGAIWTVRQWLAYAKYEKYVSGSLYISNQSTFRVHGFLPDTRISLYRSYGNGNLKLGNLVNNTPSYWEDNYFYQQSSQFRNELKFAYGLEHFDIVGGFEFRNSAIQGRYLLATETNLSGITERDTVSERNVYHTIDLGAYIQASWHLTQKLHLTTGLRWDYNQVKNQNFGYGVLVSPRFAAVYAPKKFVIKAIYAQAFKDASAFNKHSRSSIRLISNPNLKPERTQNFELTFRWRSNDTYFVEWIGYNSYYENVLSDEVVSLSNGSTTTRFVGKKKGKVFGMQLNSGWKYRNFDFYANYTFTKAKSKDNQENWMKVGDIAPHQVNLGVNRKFLKDNKLNINLRLNYVAEKPTGANTSVSDNPLTKIGAYTILHSTISYNFIPQFTLQAIVENLTDKVYFHPGVRSASGSPYAPAIPQYRRSFYIKLLYDL